MSEVSMGADQRISCGDVLEIIGMRDGGCVMRGFRWRCRGRREHSYASRISHPASRVSQALRHSLIELLFSLQEGVQVPEKHSRFCSLNDAMVVRARDRDDLRARDIADGPGRD